jgi:hypothetical protein
MIKAALAFCSVLFCMSCAFAQQPSFPFLQDGGARDSFVKSMNDSCLNAAAEHNDHSQKAQKYCICYAGAVADIINGQEYEALAADQLSDSLREKMKRAGALCFGNLEKQSKKSTLIRRRLAMRMAFTNKPEGKGYAQAFAELMKADGLHTMDKISVTAVLWLGDDPERMRLLRDLREAMTPGQRSRLNSPIRARQRVEAILQARRSGVDEGTVGASPVALLKHQIVEQAREIAELQHKLAKREEGSLFDLKHDSADDIATAIVGTLSAHKAKAPPLLTVAGDLEPV